MLQQAMKKQTAARAQGHSDAVTDRHIRIAYLPIAPLPMQDGSLQVAAWYEHHAAIFWQRFIQRDPSANDSRAGGIVEVSHILMPRFLTADERRFEQRHIL